jgi:hypothetical protein
MHSVRTDMRTRRRIHRIPRVAAIGLPAVVLAVSLLIGAFVPTRLGAQTTIPGSANVEPTRIRFGTFEYVLSVLRDGEEQILGSLIDEILPIRGDEPVIRRVQTSRRGGGLFVDSTVTDAQTLAPRWHHGVQPQRAVLLEFDGARVVGRIDATGKPARMIDATLVDAFFDASNWDLAVKSLPLEEGDAAVIQVYDVDQQLRRYTVRVADRELRGKNALVHVVVELGRNNDAHLWLDDVTRTVLRIETMLEPGVLLRQLLKP